VGGTDKPVEILLVEDNPADIQLITQLFKQTKLNPRITTVTDGEKATAHLFQKVKEGVAPRPELIILDLNLPCKDGRQVLEEVKTNPETRTIPVLIFTTSPSSDDVSRCYTLHANSYISKPSDLTRFNDVLKSIEDFWFNIVALPESNSEMGIARVRE